MNKSYDEKTLTKKRIRKICPVLDAGKFNYNVVF